MKYTKRFRSNHGNKKRLNVFMDRELYKAFKASCKEEDILLSDKLRLMIYDASLAKLEPKNGLD